VIFEGRRLNCNKRRKCLGKSKACGSLHSLQLRLKLTWPGRECGPLPTGRHAEFLSGFSRKSLVLKTLLMSVNVYLHTAEPQRPSLPTVHYSTSVSIIIH